MKTCSLTVIIALVLSAKSATAEEAYHPPNPSGLTPIPAEWVSAFSSIEPDPHPEKLTRDSHYWVSDERRHDLFRETIADGGGVFIGLGTDQNYLMAAWAKPKVLVPLDFDQMVVNLHYVFRVIFLEAKDPEAFKALWSEEQYDSTRELLKKAYADKSDAFRKGILRAFKMGSRFVRRRIHRIIKSFTRLGVPTFLTNQAQYQYIVDMFKTNRVFPVRGDLTAKKTVKQVGEAARKCGLTIRTLYLSNAEQYFKFTTDYRQNMLSLPFDDKTRVIRTAGTKQPWTADGVYDYIYQTGDNFKKWIEHKQTYNVWTIVQARDVNKKTGYSQVTRLPEEK
jgi:frataxin-like iron-binding protein CyaY